MAGAGTVTLGSGGLKCARVPERRIPRRCPVRATQGSGPSSSSHEGSAEALRQSMAHARKNLADGTSPGAGLESSEEQAAAAFADMLVVSSDNAREDAAMGRGGLSDSDLEELGGAGANMEAAAIAQKGRSRGILASLITLGNVLAGGGTTRRDDLRR